MSHRRSLVRRVKRLLSMAMHLLESFAVGSAMLAATVGKAIDGRTVVGWVSVHLVHHQWPHHWWLLHPSKWIRLKTAHRDTEDEWWKKERERKWLSKRGAYLDTFVRKVHPIALQLQVEIGIKLIAKQVALRSGLASESYSSCKVCYNTWQRCEQGVMFALWVARCERIEEEQVDEMDELGGKEKLGRKMGKGLRHWCEPGLRVSNGVSNKMVSKMPRIGNSKCVYVLGKLSWV